MVDRVRNKRRRHQYFRTLAIEPLLRREVLSAGPVDTAEIPANAVYFSGEAEATDVFAEGSPSAQIRASLAIVAAASDTDYMSHVPDSVVGIEVGSSFIVEIWVQDSSGTSDGLVGGYVDILYATEFVDSTGMADHGSVFTILEAGTTNEATGHIDDFGGATLTTGQAVAPYWVRLGYIEFTAMESGAVVFDLRPGEPQFSLAGIGNIPWADVSLAGAEARVGLTAVDDSFTARNVGSSVLLDVLANDLMLGTTPERASVSGVLPDDTGADIQVSPDGTSLLYTPSAGFEGADRFRYEIRDSTGVSDIAVVEVSVVGSPLWHNIGKPNDVNADELVEPLDALQVINAINGESLSVHLPNVVTEVQPPFVDVNGDGLLTPLDALLVINHLNRLPDAEGEYALPMGILREPEPTLLLETNASLNHNSYQRARDTSENDWSQLTTNGTERLLSHGPTSLLAETTPLVRISEKSAAVDGLLPLAIRQLSDDNILFGMNQWESDYWDREVG